MRQVKKEIRETYKFLDELIEEMSTLFDNNKRKRPELIHCSRLSDKINHYRETISNQHISYALWELRRWYDMLDNLAQHNGKVTQDEADLFYHIKDLICVIKHMLKLADEL